MDRMGLEHERGDDAEAPRQREGDRSYQPGVPIEPGSTVDQSMHLRVS
jgi:hypothetical protein